MSGRPVVVTPVIGLRELVADTVRQRVADGVYRPGDRVVERQLASDLGISHIPVREALSALAKEGLVERPPRRGARIAGLDSRTLAEITAVRTLVEQYVAVEVQRRLTDADEIELRRFVAEMVSAAAETDTGQVLRCDRRFHEHIWLLADNSVLTQVASGLRARINGLQWAAYQPLGSAALVEHARSHYAIIDAIAGSDEDEARRVVAEHVEVAARRIEASLTEPRPKVSAARVL